MTKDEIKALMFTQVKAWDDDRDESVVGELVEYTEKDTFKFCILAPGGHVGRFTNIAPHTPETRLMTPLELAGKWIRVWDLPWHMVNQVSSRKVCMPATNKWYTVEDLHELEYQWCDHPSEEMKSLEVEE
jgi:hypothetical protein